jgi:aspartyl/glutamyl-tRNA(Asn/Gln) amidotransferase C subunit
MSSKKFTVGDARHMSSVSKIPLDTQGEKEIVKQLDLAAGHLGTFKKVRDRLAGIRVKTTATELDNQFRADEARPSLTQKDALANTPNSKDGFFLVPGVQWAE